MSGATSTPGADTAGDHVAVGVDPGLVRREQSGIDLLLNVGVVLGELVQTGLPEEVGPAVAHLPDEVALGQQHQDGGRGPHAPLVVLRQGALEDGIVGRADGRRGPARPASSSLKPRSEPMV